jgi:hypothetical protein
MIRKVIDFQGSDQIPRWYRIAYEDYARRAWVCYPFGIHWLARAVYSVWEHSLLHRPTALQRLISELVDMKVRQRIEEYKEEQATKKERSTRTMRDPPLTHT